MDLGIFIGILTITSLVTYGLVDRYKALRPTASATEIVVVSLLAAFGVPFLLAYSTFGDQIEVGQQTLADLNTAALIFIGLLGAGGSSVLNQLVGSGGPTRSTGAIGNIGDNRGA